jgi:hypothetical protein
MSDDLWDDLHARIQLLRERMRAVVAADADNDARRLAFAELSAPITEAARAADELFQDGVTMMLDEILVEHGLMVPAGQAT